jgi:hypothetical protein
MSKQTCSWCGRDRKQKHFSSGSADCNDCVNQQQNQRLAGSGPNPNGGGTFPPGFPPGLANILNGVAPGGGGMMTFGTGSGPTNCGGPQGQRPPKKKKERKVVYAEDVEEHKCPGDETCPICVPESLNPWKRKAARSVEEVSTFVDSGLVKRIELQLEYGMNDNGMPLTDAERADLQKQYAKLTFQSEAEVDEDEEAEALKSILGGSDVS